jgi:putative membrane protein
MTAEQPLDTSTRLAVERTRLANERTLMAWIRTSTSLIAFGFTIFKFFQYLATQEHRHTVVSPWVVGMTMIVIGLTGLALAWVQHRQQMKALKAEAGPMPYSISGIMAGFIAVLGVIALVVVALRLQPPNILRLSAFGRSHSSFRVGGRAASTGPV